MNNTQKLINYLSQFVTQHKRALMADVIKQRTRYVSVVLEDVYQSQNAGAILRTSDCFGIQDVHVIEQRNKLRLSAVAMGAQKWLTIKKYKDTAACLTQLKEHGYRIVATTPHTDTLLSDLPINHKIALVFGNEDEGISQAVQYYADEKIKIPMYGFTESFNISVSVAICLYDIIHRLRASDIDLQLSEKEKAAIQLGWLRKIIKESDKLEKSFLKEG